MYTNAQYIKNLSGDVNGIRCDINGVTSFVPIAPDNTDYKNIMALVKDNKLTIAPAEEQK
jgi:CTP-dependent riboflavin kinase